MRLGTSCLPLARDLLAAAARSGIALRRASAGPGAYGRFDAATLAVLLCSGLDLPTDVERAAVLAHELQHAVDFAAGRVARARADCLSLEEAGFARSAAVWSDLTARGLISSATGHSPIAADLDTITRARADGSLPTLVATRYATTCP